MKKALCLAAILCLLAAVPSEAQNRRGAVEIGINAGAMLFDADLEDELSLGLTLGINYTDRQAIELSYTYVDTETLGTSRIDAEVWYLSLGWQWNWHPGGKITSPHVPYFGIGVGYNEFNFKAAGVDDPDFWYLYIDVGYRYYFNRVFGLRWDVKAISRGEDGSLNDAFGADQVDVNVFMGLSWMAGG